MSKMFDVIVIGAGPGGYVAAIKSAKLGMKTAIVEEREAGGTCLNRGCIPTKALLHAAKIYREVQNCDEFGIQVKDAAFDYEKIFEYKEETSKKLVQGIDQLLKANGVERFTGRGTLLSGKRVRVVKGDDVQEIDAESIILAAGSKPAIPPIPGMELSGVVTSDELFRMKKIPERLVIIGGGVIGVEFATVYASFGTKVTIIEALPRLVPNMDKEISQSLKMTLKKRGIDIYTSASVQKVEEIEGAYNCIFVEKEKEQCVTGDLVLCAVGRMPNTDGLFAEDAVPVIERRRVIVNERFETSIEGVYAIGDLIPGPQLAHVSSAHGVTVAELLAGRTPSIALEAVPGCLYTDPEAASVGLTEEEAKAQNIEIVVGKFIMSANGKSLITKEDRGFVKIIARKEDHVILGAQMMCARATDMIGELVTAVANGLTVSQMLRGMRAHPTYNEGIGEALEELEGGAIHIVPRKKP